MILREGTVDRDVFVANHEQNEYGVPDKMDGWVVLDIGAHIGAFSYTCMHRGARIVYAYEPDSQNYEIAVKNLKEFGGEVVVSNLAVWGSGSACRLYHPKLSSYGMLGTTVNTGGSSLVFHQGVQDVRTIDFDDAIQVALALNHVPMVDLIKMDCEGSEWPILFTSRKLHKIKQIVGEFHEGTLPFALKGYRQFTIDKLVDLLSASGFQVEYRRHGTIEEGLGLCKATRS